MRIAHFSDPHFATHCWHWNYFFSKRWIGHLNAFLFRRSFYDTAPLFQLPAFFEQMEVEHIFITGDLTTTSLTSEFEQAKKFTQLFKKPVHILPGNHDCYTKEEEITRPFYRFFPQKPLCFERLNASWWWVGLDCTLATPPFHAYGQFTSAMQQELETILSAIPRTDSIIFANHFPLYPHNRPKHDLKGVQLLQNTLKAHSNVVLYLHGHDHVHYEIDGLKNNLPHVFNSGSGARKKQGGFSIFDLSKTEALHFRYECGKAGHKNGAPQLIYKQSYLLRRYS